MSELIIETHLKFDGKEYASKCIKDLERYCAEETYAAQVMAEIASMIALTLRLKRKAE